MFQPISLFIGLRYVRTRRQGFFVSFISWVSMLGICVGVAALITVISVMNGFERELRDRLLSMASHATLSSTSGPLGQWQVLAEKSEAFPGVVAAAPYSQFQVMLGRGADLSGAMLRGILPERENRVSAVGQRMAAGSLEELVPGSQRIVLGAGLAWLLQARVGDEVTVLLPQAGTTDNGVFDIKPRIQTFTVSGIFEAGVQEHDNSLALVNLEDAEALAETTAPNGLRLKFSDIFAAPQLAPQVAKTLGSNLQTTDWSEENATYFRAVKIEKTMMTFILMLIVAVAAFNIVSALVMVVNEKRTDIAILRTVGLPPRSVISIFMTQGVIIGWFGTLLGLALGLTLALNVETIVPALESIFGFHFMDPTVYYVTEIPSEVHGEQVAFITGTALILTVCSTIYPALRGARTEPAEALRYE
jgi:lipoprotein-releasing system permease protein